MDRMGMGLATPTMHGEMAGIPGLSFKKTRTIILIAGKWEYPWVRGMGPGISCIGIALGSTSPNTVAACNEGKWYMKRMERFPLEWNFSDVKPSFCPCYGCLAGLQDRKKHLPERRIVS
jgi:hypothetical protein